MRPTPFLLVVLALAAAAACEATTSASANPVSSTKAMETAASERALALGRELTARFYAGDTAAVWARMADKVRGDFGSEQDLVAYVRRIEGQLGDEVAVLDEQVIPDPPFEVYLRTAVFSTYERLVRVTWTVDADANVVAFVVDPDRADPPVAQSRPLRLPFSGTWKVKWAGADRKSNGPHFDHASQRRAADLVIVGENGNTYRGDGKRNEDYFAYGKEVRAVADGRVITVVDGILDNLPGATNPDVAPGNVVLVDHGERLVSVYAHLQPGSIQVKPGSLVETGQVLGRCGNSGNSREPHLHFHLQDGPLLEKSWGIEAVFDGVGIFDYDIFWILDGYRFRRGDWITGWKTHRDVRPSE